MCVCVCVCVCILTTTSLHFNLAKSVLCDSTGQLHPCKPCCICDKQKNFDGDINSELSHMAIHTCCRAGYFVSELTQISCRLLRKVLCIIRVRLFIVVRSHMTCKYSFGQIDPTRRCYKHIQSEKCP